VNRSPFVPVIGRPDLGLRFSSIVIAILCAPALLRIALSVPLHVSLNYNEGWNAYHAAEVMRGATLYPAVPRFFFNNYPPLSFYALAASSHVFGDPIVAGRWISLAAFLVWAALLQPVSRVLGCRSDQALFAALIFAANMLVFTDYVGINDPELLGHAVAGLGLLAVLRRPRTTWRIGLSAGLMTLAVFIKHTLVAMPVACVMWLVMFDRRAGYALLLAGVASITVGIVCCAWIFGPGFLSQLVSPRTYIIARAVRRSAFWMMAVMAFVAMLILLLRRFPRDESVAFCALYAGIATVVGAIFIGGDGINWNVMFDATWALCLSAAVALSRLWGSTIEPRRICVRLTAAYLVAPAIALVVNARAEWFAPDYWLAPRRAEAAATARDIAFIKDHAGPALCEELALCFWADKSVEVDIFSVQQRIRGASTLSADLVRLLDMRYFAVVQLDTESRPLGQPFDEALLRNYRVNHETLKGRLLVPQ
jgi:hypothetical protein